MTFLELVETILRGEGYKIVVPRGAPKTMSLIWEAIVIASMAKEYGLSAQQIVRLVNELSKTTSRIILDGSGRGLENRWCG